MSATERTVIRGVTWTLGTTVLGQSVSWISTVIVARILAPSDFGIFAMGSVFVGLTWILTEFGFGSAILRFRHLTDRHIAQVGTVCVLIGIAGALVVAGAAVPLARFYRTPELVPVLLAQGVSLIILSFRTVPLALMRRNLDLRGAAINDLTNLLILSIVTTALAIAGFRYWTLVVGAMSSALVTTVLAFRRQPHRFAWPKRREIAEVAVVGSHVVVQRLAWYFYSQADIFIVARMFGQQGAGMYGFASTIVNSPIQKIQALSPKVTSPSFAANQDNQPQLRRLFLLATEGMSLLTFPAAIGLAAVAPLLIRVVLTPAWEPMGPVMQILAISAAFASITPMIPSLLNTIGQSKAVMTNGLRIAIMMPIAFLIGSQFGLRGVATGWLIALPIGQVFLYRDAFRLLDLRASRYVGAVTPAAVSSILMGLSVLGLDRLSGQLAGPLRLGVEIGAGALVYGACLLTLFRRRTLTVIDGVRQALRSQKASPAKGTPKPDPLTT